LSLVFAPKSGSAGRFLQSYIFILLSNNLFVQLDFGETNKGLGDNTMAKFKLRGEQELKFIDNEKAKRLKDFWLDELISNDKKINLGHFYIKKGQVEYIILDEELKENDEFEKKLTDIYSQRNKLLNLDPQKRAEHEITWAHFSFFYSAVFGITEKPNESYKHEVIEKSKEFFKKNPEYAYPVYSIWLDILKLDNQVKVNSYIFNLVLRGECSEEEDIKKTKEYRESLSKKEEINDLFNE